MEVALLEQELHQGPVDLTQLIGGNQFLVDCRVYWKDKTMTFQCLVDTGANAYALINQKHIRPLTKVLQMPLHKLKTPVPLRGFDGQPSEAIRYLATVDLAIDRHSQTRQYLLAANLGSHDMILGRKWLAKHDVLPDCRRNQLHWPENRETNQPDLAQKIRHFNDKCRKGNRSEDTPTRILKGTSKIRPEKQKDVLLTPPRDLLTRKAEYQARKEELDLDALETVELLDHPRCFVGAAAFQSSTKDPGNLVGSVTIDEIDHILEKQGRKPKRCPLPPVVIRRLTLQPAGCYAQTSDLIYSLDADEPDALGNTLSFDPKELQELRVSLPIWLRDMARAFSKKAADELPQSRPFDHKLRFDGPDPSIKTAHLYKMSSGELEKMREYLVENLKKGFIKPSESPFSSPVLFVKKKDGSLRFCIDYRQLNAVTKKDRYPLPLITETLDRLAESSVFTKLDVRHAFNRIRMEPASMAWAAFRTRYGSFEPVVLPFGLCNGPATFQRYINTVLMDCLDDFCSAYVDDVLIFSKNKKEHRRHVRTVLQKLQDAGLQVDIRKCEFEVSKTTFLGFVISDQGVQVDPAKTSIIRNWRRPTTKREVQSFLGFCNFYRRFIQAYGRVSRPLNRLTERDTPPKFTLDETQLDAFNQLKNLLLSAPILLYFKYDRETRLETDCSDLAAAGMLSQKSPEDGQWHPVSFYSKALQGAESHYEVHDKELLAVIQGLREWRAELISLPNFLIVTDHKALEYFGTKRPLNGRQIRWMGFLSQFHYQITYRPGKDNTIADILSRKDELTPTQKQAKEAERTRQVIPSDLILASAETKDTAHAPAEVEGMDELLVAVEVLQANRTDPALEDERKKARENADSWEMSNDCVLRDKRLVVPDGHNNLRTRLLQQIHGTMTTAHPGRNKTKILVRRLYWWPTLSVDIDRFVANCHECRRSHRPRDKTPGLLHPLPVPLRTWDDLSMDFHTPGSVSKGYDNIFVVVDRLSKRYISLPTTKNATARTAAGLFYRYIWRFRGSPLTITSDRGPQFISDFMNELSRLTRTKLKLSTAEHAQTDGQTEIVNQIVDTRLRPFINYFQDDWADLLPALDAAGAACPHESTGLSPSMVDYGYEPRLNFDWTLLTTEFKTPRERLNREEAQQWAKRIDTAVNYARECMAAAQERQAKQANKKRREPDFGPGDMVYVIKKTWKTDRPSDKLDYPLAGPFKIDKMVGHSYQLDLPPSYRIWPIFHADRLRKDPANPLPGQTNEEPGSTKVNGELEWEVEKILSSKVLHSKLYYKIEWKGWDIDDEWYLASNFKNSALELRKFHEQNPGEAGPPVRLNEWIRCAEEDEFDEDHPDDNKPRQQGLRNQRRRRKT
jgi:hypothetical protein